MRIDIVSKYSDTKKFSKGIVEESNKGNSTFYSKENIANNHQCETQEQDSDILNVSDIVSFENRVAAQPKLSNIKEALAEMGKINSAIESDSVIASRLHNQISAVKVLSLVGDR